MCIYIYIYTKYHISYHISYIMYHISLFIFHMSYIIYHMLPYSMLYDITLYCSARALLRSVFVRMASMPFGSSLGSARFLGWDRSRPQKVGVTLGWLWGDFGVTLGATRMRLEIGPFSPKCPGPGGKLVWPSQLACRRRYRGGDAAERAEGAARRAWRGGTQGIER